MILEGLLAEYIIDFSNDNDVDLIALSTHGHSGLSGRNVSSVLQKIVLRSFKSTLWIRAYTPPSLGLAEIQYSRLFVGLDYSTRAEYILPVAINLAKYYKSQLILSTVISKPEIPHRFPLAEEDGSLAKHIAERNYNVETRLMMCDNAISALHDMGEQENVNLVMLVAHGHSDEGRWPYGSIATSFIAYGSTSLMVMQDLSGDEIRRTQAEIAPREIKGH